MKNIIYSNSDLSLEAKGLYALLKDYLQDNKPILNKACIQLFCMENETDFQSAWNELQNKGYLKKIKRKSENGFFDYEYKLTEKV